jgi:hypothetical protein
VWTSAGTLVRAQSCLDGRLVGHQRGVVAGALGLYFVGRFFLYALTSSLIHGTGRDAEHIAAQIAGKGAIPAR